MHRVDTSFKVWDSVSAMSRHVSRRYIVPESSPVPGVKSVEWSGFDARSWGMNVNQSGALNLAGFVRSTAGRNGLVKEVDGGVLVAGPIAVPNAYVTAAIPTGNGSSTAKFLDEAISFFSDCGRTFVLWAPQSEPSFAEESDRRNLMRYSDPSPAMVVTSPPNVDLGLRFRLVDDEESAGVFGDLCERGYEAKGMARLMAHRQSYRADNSYWYIAFDGDVAVSAACGYLSGSTGGIYCVATPKEFRGRGYAAGATSMATTELFDRGATQVVLQASEVGFGVYERLGFGIYDHYEEFTVPAGPH
jgi:ribosomal protein S18 acetylase RimI-like enzyme